MLVFCFYGIGDHRDLLVLPRSFPIRRSSDLPAQLDAVLLRDGRARRNDGAERRTAVRDDLGCRRARAKPGLHAHRRGNHHAADYWLHRLGLLGFPRQGRRRRLSLMTPPEAKPLWQRLGWMAGIWLARVIVLGAVAYVIRFWLKV